MPRAPSTRGRPQSQGDGPWLVLYWPGPDTSRRGGRGPVGEGLLRRVGTGGKEGRGWDRTIRRLPRRACTASSIFKSRALATLRARAMTKTPSGKWVWSPVSRALSWEAPIRSRSAKISKSMPRSCLAAASVLPSFCSSGIGSVGGSNPSLVGVVCWGSGMPLKEATP